MRKNIEISDEKINEFLEQFYSYFESGYAFEEFLKVYLEKIGLDEVVVTQRSSDGGIDLEAVRWKIYLCLNAKVSEIWKCVYVHQDIKDCLSTGNIYV